MEDGAETRSPQVTVDEEGLVRFAQELVRIPSVFDPATGRDEEKAGECVAGRMRLLGWNPVVDWVAEGRPNVMATVEGSRPGPTLLFEGHMDVVTEGDRDAWSRDPFSGEISEGRLYGRGSADMKGGVAAMIYAVAALQEMGSLPGRIIVAVLSDEEGMMSGVKHFIGSGRAKGVDAAIVCEPEGGEICTSQKGAMRIIVRADGRMAHGAMPQEGRNPVSALADLVVAARTRERALSSEVGEHPTLGSVFITPTVFQSGSCEQLNVISSKGILGLDVRTIPGVDHAALVVGLTNDADEIGQRHGLPLHVDVIEDRPATEVSEGSLLVTAVRLAHECVLGRPAIIGGVPGTTDGTILTRDAAIPVVVYGPGGKWIAHQANEYVDLADLLSAARVYADAARRFLTA